MHIQNRVHLGLWGGRLWSRCFFCGSLLLLATSLQADTPQADSGGVLEINWDEVPSAEASVNQLSLVKTSPRLRSPAALARLSQGLASVKLPVYLPKAELNYTETSVIAEDNAYDVSVQVDNATILISGDRFYQQELSAATEDLVAQAKTPANEASFNIAEGIAEASFNRFGANYSLSIECAEPNTDKRCTQLDFIREVYASLVLVRGK